MRKLSQREFILVNLLIIVVIVYFGIIKLLIPMYSELDNQKIYLEQLKTDEATTYALISTKSTLEEKIKTNTVDYESFKKRLSPFLNNDTIISNLTLLCSKNNLKASMSMIDPSILENEKQEALENDIAIPENININYVNMKAFGDITNISRLINDINVIEYINIRNATILNEDEVYTVIFELGVYTCLD